MPRQRGLRVVRTPDPHSPFIAEADGDALPKTGCFPKDGCADGSACITFAHAGGNCVWRLDGSSSGEQNYCGDPVIGVCVRR